MDVLELLPAKLNATYSTVKVGHLQTSDKFCCEIVKLTSPTSISTESRWASTLMRSVAVASVATRRRAHS